MLQGRGRAPRLTHSPVHRQPQTGQEVLRGERKLLSIEPIMLKSEHLPLAEAEEQWRPGIARTFAPHCQHRAPARSQRAVQFAQRGFGVWHVHQAERAQRDVETGVRQRELLGVHA